MRKTLPYKLYSWSVVFGKRPRKTIVFLHGIGNSGMAWREVINQLEGSDVRIIVLDLLGFGRSPRPRYAEYDVATQARSVRLALLLRGVFWKKIILVGHSMGSLVSIEFAKRYPARVTSLILCSPPLYSPPHGNRYSVTTDDVLRKLYMSVQSSPKQFLKVAEVAMKYELINSVFNVTDENVQSYMAALQAAIINQTSLRDIAQLTLPIHIVRGTLDPVLVPRHIKRLAKTHDNITLTSIVAGHEVKGRFIPYIIKAIEARMQ